MTTITAITAPPSETLERWQLTDLPQGIYWDAANDTRLPHADHFEMSGRKVSVIIRYAVDANRNLNLTREVIWPTLRLTVGDVRGYLRRRYDDRFSPKFAVEGQVIPLGPLDSVTISGGVIRFAFKPLPGLQITRTLFPARTQSVVVENWAVTNSGAASSDLSAFLPTTRKR